MSNSNQSLIFFISEVSCFIKVRTTSTLFSGMFWLGCYSCSCCGGNRIKSTPCSQTWTRTRTKQQLFLIFPYPYSKRLKPNWESTKHGISGSRIPKKVLPSEEGFTKKFRSLLQVPGLSEKNSSIAIMYHTYKNFLSLFISKPSCIMLTGIFICFLLPNLRIFRDISRSHLIDFVVWITQKWGRSGLVKFGPEEGQHVLWTGKKVEVLEKGIKRLNFKNLWNEQSFIFAI